MILIYEYINLNLYFNNLDSLFGVRTKHKNNKFTNYCSYVKKKINTLKKIFTKKSKNLFTCKFTRNIFVPS